MSPAFVAFSFFLPIHSLQMGEACQGKSKSVRGRQEDAASIVGVLAMVSNYVLPALFGLIGTVTAAVRSIQCKIRDSLLSPRDRILLQTRLPLGIMAGICVGLFLTPSSMTLQPAVSAGAFTLSASGIAFMAGYGSEAFFVALDGLIERTFSLAPSSHANR